MEIITQLRAWTEAFLPKHLFLVDIEQKGAGKKITVYIDGDEAIDIYACQNLSKHLSEKLDEGDFGNEAYVLEVSSPGAERPLKVSRQYPKHVGRELLIKLNSATELTARLDEVNEQGITIALKDKKKGYKDAPVKEIPFTEIAEATVIISFK